MKFYKTIGIRSGFYDCKTWGMTSRGESRQQVAEMWFLRSMIGKTRRGKIKNDDIRNKLHVESLNDTVDEYREN
jgi:hypothetical protein